MPSPSVFAPASAVVPYDNVSVEGLVSSAASRTAKTDYVANDVAYGVAPFNHVRHLDPNQSGAIADSVPAIAFASVMQGTSASSGDVKKYPTTIYCIDPQKNGDVRFFLACSDPYTSGRSPKHVEDQHIVKLLRPEYTTHDGIFTLHIQQAPDDFRTRGNSLHGIYGNTDQHPRLAEDKHINDLLVGIQNGSISPKIDYSPEVERQAAKLSTKPDPLQMLAMQMRHDLGFANGRHNDLSPNLVMDHSLATACLDLSPVAMEALQSKEPQTPHQAFTAKSSAHAEAIYYLDPQDRDRLKPIMMFAGSQGSGKSTLARELGSLYRNEAGESHFVGCTTTTNLEDLAGRHIPHVDHAGNKSFVYVEGPIGQAMRTAAQGKPALVVLDEFNSIPAREQNDFKAFLGYDRRRGEYTLVTGRKQVDPETGILAPEVLKAPAKNLAFMLTGNVGPGFVSDQGDDALVERQTRVQMDYDPKAARAVLENVASAKGMSNDVVSKMLRVEKALDANRPETDWRIPLGMRAMVRTLEMAERTEDVPRYLALHADSIANRTDHGEVIESQRSAIHHKISTAFGVTEASLAESLTPVSLDMQAVAKRGPVHRTAAALLDPDRPGAKPFLLLEGPAGSGKSTVARDIGAALVERGGGFEQVLGTSKTTYESMVGQLEPFIDEHGNKTFAWADGPVAKAFRNAAAGKKTLLNIEEMAEIPPRVLAELKSPLAVNALDRTFELRTGRVVPHPQTGNPTEEIIAAPQDNLMVIATANPKGDAVYGDKAFVDRFMTLSVPKNREITQRAIEESIDRRGFEPSQGDLLLRFSDAMEKANKDSTTHSTQFARMPSARTLGDVVEFAKTQEDIPRLLANKANIWAAEGLDGKPDQNQRTAIVDIINSTYGTRIK